MLLLLFFWVLLRRWIFLSWHCKVNFQTVHIYCFCLGVSSRKQKKNSQTYTTKRTDCDVRNVGYFAAFVINIIIVGLGFWCCREYHCHSTRCNRFSPSLFLENDLIFMCICLLVSFHSRVVVDLMPPPPLFTYKWKIPSKNFLLIVCVPEQLNRRVWCMVETHKTHQNMSVN